MERYYKTPKTKIAKAILNKIEDGDSLEDISFYLDDVECYLREGKKVLDQLVEAGIIEMLECIT